ncbi:hypothetical protein AUQ44_03325 [Vibrio cidicii]|uniref:Uncharacterized protein n=1 Tax=Vibrio cidicii TaxID=1763883 RepID=A0A151JH11_9VIBR|nr:hypothetical protein AUQ44_03325 [Vibrio cidicii]POB79602.1 hypothetical protein CRN30_15435 [Vibrio vulnificus]
MFLDRNFFGKKCVISRQEIIQKREGQLIEKVEIKIRFGFKKVDRKVKRNLENFYSKMVRLLIEKMDNSLHQF